TSDLARQYGVCDSTIADIRTRRTWRHLNGDQAANVSDMKWQRRSGQGEKNRNAKLTSEQVLAIRQSTERPIVLARRYGVGYPMIWAIRSRRSWKHLP